MATKKMKAPVDWHEYGNRQRFRAEYVVVGSIPGVLTGSRSANYSQEEIRRAVSQSQILTRKDVGRNAGGEDERRIAAIVMKVLQRGVAPPPTLGVEAAALKHSAMLDHGICAEIQSPDPEIGWRVRPESQATAVEVLNDGMRGLLRRRPFRLEPGMASVFDSSNAERRFLEEWLPREVCDTAPHWVTPQAPLGRLLESGGVQTKSKWEAERVDFLIWRPGAAPFVVEIDGLQHEDRRLVDNARDKRLASIDIEVLRVPAREVSEGRGPCLDAVRDRFIEILGKGGEPDETSPFSRMLSDCSFSTKVQYTLAKALNDGVIAGREWRIELRGGGRFGLVAVKDALAMIANLDALYGRGVSPNRCTVVDMVSGAEKVLSCEAGTVVEQSSLGQVGNHDTTVRILVESDSSPFDTVSDPDAHYVIRPACLPVELAVEQHAQKSRAPIAYEGDAYEKPLRYFLRNVFRKREFRQGQARAIDDTLRHEPRAVLLPTGAGKSLIYQMAGLLMPGMTIVVDPLIALMDDQIQNMRLQGIDRATQISSSWDRDQRRLTSEQMKRGQFHFVLVTPERLQINEFLSGLEAMSADQLVNLLVVDEAHCVSEWGHDFRPAYLGVADVARGKMQDADGVPPELLALTGTASRAVLRDMLVELGFSTDDPKSVIRPDSFDRPELSFEIIRATDFTDARSKLTRVLNQIPNDLNTPRSQFWRTGGLETKSGIVFTRNATGFRGIESIGELVKPIGKTVALFSGGPPFGDNRDTNWDKHKLRYASEFKNDLRQVMVATKAYGMGIDKPNVRFIVHFGLPGSLESLYQEVGRAGRDGQDAVCKIIFTEHHSGRSRQLVDPGADLDELIQLSRELDQGGSKIRDDITSAVWFHKQSFPTTKKGIEDIQDVVKALTPLDVHHSEALPFKLCQERSRTEHALVTLRRLKIIEDYTVAHGPKYFEVKVRPFDFERSKSKLLDYVNAAQPHQAHRFRQDLDQIDPSDDESAALALAERLVRFRNDVIEGSRRRAIYEAVNVARTAKGDPDIRSRILNYLGESVDAESVDGLCRKQDIELTEWFDLIQRLHTEPDFDSLRRTCSQALVDYPRQPGLLFTRAVTESMCASRDSHVSWIGIKDGLKECDKWRVERREVESFVDSLWALAATRAPGLGAPLTMALLTWAREGSQATLDRSKTIEQARELNDRSGEIRAVIALDTLEAGIAGSQSLTKSIANRYRSTGIKTLLTGDST